MKNEVKKHAEFLQAYDEFADAIFRHCCFRISNREKAQDLMQETFIRTWEYIARGEKIKNIRPFLYRIANNLIIDEYRKRKNYSLEEMRERGFDPGEDRRERSESILDAKKFMKIIETLDPKYRDIVVMRYIDELSLKEISELTGETENNVSVKIHRAIAKIRDLTEQTDQNYYA